MQSFTQVIVLSAVLLVAPSVAFAPLQSASSVAMSSQLNMVGPDEMNALSSSIAQADLLPTGVFDSLRSTIQCVATDGGPAAMALAAAVTDTVPLVPTQPIAVMAGFLFGLKLGLPAIVAGQALATTFSILVGRFVLKESEWNVFDQAEDGDQGKLAKVLAELTSGLNSNDFKTVFLTILLARQTPVLPFSLGNYFVGAATEAQILPAVAGTIVGCLPLNLLFVAAGSGGMAAVDMVKENGLMAEGLESVGAVVTLGIAAVVAKTVMKVYNEEDAESVTS